MIIIVIYACVCYNLHSSPSKCRNSWYMRVASITYVNLKTRRTTIKTGPLRSDPNPEPNPDSDPDPDPDPDPF